jgi:hypothetical protein
LIIAWISVKDTVGSSVAVNTGSGFDSGQQWQNDLGDNWKNNPIQKGGEHSTLIDMNGDGLPDRVFDRNPSSNQEGIYVYLNRHRSCHSVLSVHRLFGLSYISSHRLSHVAIADLSQTHYLY